MACLLSQLLKSPLPHFPAPGPIDPSFLPLHVYLPGKDPSPWPRLPQSSSTSIPVSSYQNTTGQPPWFFSFWLLSSLRCRGHKVPHCHAQQTPHFPSPVCNPLAYLCLHSHKLCSLYPHREPGCFSPVHFSQTTILLQATLASLLRAHSAHAQGLPGHSARSGLPVLTARRQSDVTGS